MNFEESEWREIVSQIARLTDSGSLHWRAVPDEDGDAVMYEAQVGPSSVYRLWSIDQDERFPYRLEVFRRKSDDEWAWVANYDTSAYDVGEYSTSELLDSLYPIVQRTVSGAPQLAQELLSELKSLGATETPF